MRRLFLILDLARRDLRGGMRTLWIAVAGIALGVAAIAAVGTLGAAVLEGVRAEAREGIGGDISLRLFHRPADPAARQVLEAAGRLSEIAELRPLARTADGATPVLVELKAVDDAYPLVGHVELSPAVPLGEVLARQHGLWGAAVDQALLAELGAETGDSVHLGDIAVVIRAVLLHEPDRSFRALTLGPRVIIHRNALEATGLAPPGAPVYWYYRLRLADAATADAVITDIETRYPDAGFRIVNAADGMPGVERTVDVARVLLLLMAVAVLLVGGVGVAAAVSAHLAGKTTTVATFRSLGASQRLVFAVLLAEILAATVLAVLIGLFLGGGGALVVAALAPEALPLPAGLMPDARAFAVAAGFGMLTALAFGLWSLARIRDAAPQHLFRDLVMPRGRPAAKVAFAALAAAGAVAALLLAVTGMPLIAALFTALAGAGVIALLGAAKAVAWAARRAPKRLPAAVRLAVGNLGRPGAATLPVVMAAGLGLTVLVTVAIVADHAHRHLRETLPAEAPDLFFLAIPPDRADAFATALSGQAGVERVAHTPFVHGRLTRINGTPVHQLQVPRDVAWLVRGDRGLSWSAMPPAGATLTDGTWWPADYAGPPLASLDARVAARLGLAVGDRITVDLVGRPVEAAIANLRAVDWTGIDLDFPILLSPPREPLPYTHVAAAWLESGAVEPTIAAMADRFPASPAVRVAAILDSLERLVAAVAGALLAAAAAVTATAVVVLAGSLAASWYRRVDEMVLMQVLGGHRRQIAGAAALELAILGLVTAVLATAFGTAAGYAVVLQITPDGGAPLSAVSAKIAAVAVAAMALAGWLLPQRALARSPAALLRARHPAT
ncbi:MAG: FtsX-like permease family protein [Rhodospirillales bacterium]|nr:MAG: FtsX-like permease family protein [Rhodospirillales bacterium]